jgi:ribonucleotide reductase alpha subunit
MCGLGRIGEPLLWAYLILLILTLLEFLSVKLDQGQLNNFNISVAITDRFLEAVELGEDWYFTFNNKEYHMYNLVRNDEELFQWWVKMKRMPSPS